MGKNVVVCCDGTGNEYGECKTNVLKLYSVLERREGRQVAFYDPGVGTFSAPAALTRTAKAVTRLFGVAFGLGVTKNIEDAYRFLMENYESDDQVYIFGFSRGAYTARALVALLYKCGLLSPGNENLIPYALKTFKYERRPRLYSGFRHAFSRRCSVHFLGLWDTVKSVGWIYNPVTLQFTMRNPIVKVVRHAIAIDERRCFYRQNLWGEPFEHQDVKQVWFAGAHSDVGGSYPERESGLSQVALEWMVDEAVRCKLLVDRKRLELILPQPEETATTEEAEGVSPEADEEYYAPPDHKGPIHKSLRGPWWIAEFLPKLYEDPRRDFKRRLKLPLGKRRFIAPDPLIHSSVARRMEEMSYKPSNLPERYRVEPWRPVRGTAEQ